jgi:hypothetical protein
MFLKPGMAVAASSLSGFSPFDKEFDDLSPNSTLQIA